MPHGYRLLRHPLLILVHGGSDVLIFTAYFATPFALMRFIRLRPGLGCNRLVVLFAVFIMFFGLTHLLSFFTLWSPIYVELAAVKLMTALVSLTAAAVLFPLVPRLARILGPFQLQAANDGLRDALATHERTMVDLQEARDQLEEKVARRTAELEEADARLSLVVRETTHRGKHLLTVVQALPRRTARHEPDKEALAGAAETLVRRGEREVGELSMAIGSQLQVYRDAFRDRIIANGPPVQIRARLPGGLRSRCMNSHPMRASMARPRVPAAGRTWTGRSPETERRRRWRCPGARAAARSPRIDPDGRAGEASRETTRGGRFIV